MYWQLGRQKCVRDGNWKLVLNARDTDGQPVSGSEKVFLSNLFEDATERRNLAGRYPEVVNRLRRMHARWAEEVVR